MVTKMNIYKSIINEKILHNFSDIHGVTLMNHVANSYDIEMAIAFANLFCPEVIEVDGCVFIAEFYHGNIQELKNNYETVREIEMFVNSWSLSSLLKDNHKLNYAVPYIVEFAKAIQYFWQIRMKNLFPDKDIVVEIGEDIMGEEGTTVTVYQK